MPTAHPAQLADLTAVRRFLLGGLAIFTLVSKVTGACKTFKVEATPDKVDFYFVKLLTGSDNDSEYTYLCCLWQGANGDLGSKLNRQAWGLEAFEAFGWLLRLVNLWHRELGYAAPEVLRHRQARFTEQCEVWHEGKCCRCGRTLTTPESIASGIGPVCAEKGA